MDLLWSPKTPIRVVEKARYFCGPDDHWDGGPFLTYAQRRGLLHMVPLALRVRPGGGSEVATLETPPYTEVIHPTAVDEVHKLYTTWLWVGLLAEFLGANRQEDPERAPDIEGADDIILDIYKYCVTTAEQDGMDAEGREDSAVCKDEGPYLTARIIPSLVPAMTTLINRNSNVQSRLEYLADCLRLASGMLSEGALRPDFDRPLKFAIAALGEMLGVLIQTRVVLKYFGEGVTMPQCYFSWKSDYLAHDGPVRRQMVEDAGWCPRDLIRANATYERLFTTHYLSLLDRRVPGRDHSGCDGKECVAAQINNETYKLSHAVEGCECEEFEVDIRAVKDILLESETYPILVFDPEVEEAVASVQAFRPGEDEYVALSHVWADGLGNTKGNTLQKCQIKRLRSLIKGVEDAAWALHGTDKSEPRPKYHLWIDTLCCPVARLEPTSNRISLMRMKTVYEQAAHVLVLDLALSMHDARGLEMPELLLRIFGTSLWMRRLWTLQEGVLAKSLFFQFRDEPVQAKSLLDQMFQAPHDFKNWTLQPELNREYKRLTDLSPAAQRAGKSGRHSMYGAIEAALDFRGVSVPSDEAICIATLLGLDLAQILGAADLYACEEEVVERRMCRLWELLAEADGGISAGLIFTVDEPLATPGFGWAPRSLLGKHDQGAGTRYRQSTFLDGGTTDGRIPSGIITDAGLAVEFPGMLLNPVGLVRKEGVPPMLHPWDGILKHHKEDVVFFFDPGANKWYQMIDWHSSMLAPAKTTIRQLLRHNTGGCRDDGRGDGDEESAIIESDRPICSAIDSGKVAIIKGAHFGAHRPLLCLLVQLMDQNGAEQGSGLGQKKQKPRATPRLTRDGSDQDSVQDQTKATLASGWGQRGQQAGAIRVRWLRKVIVSELHGPDLILVRSLRNIAQEVADDPCTPEFVRARAAHLAVLRGMSGHMGSTTLSGVHGTASVETNLGDLSLEAEKSQEEKDFEAAKERLRNRMEDATATAWAGGNSGFAEAVTTVIGDGMEEYIWSAVPLRYSHHLVAHATPPEQRWIVD